MITATEDEILKMYQSHSMWDWYWGQDHYVRWKTSLLPLDLRGKTVLEVGGMEGYYSLIAERRGAKRVLCTDEETSGHRGCFPAVSKKLGATCEYRTLSVYDLDSIEEKFDVVLFLDVYYHLESPVEALRQIRRRAKGEMYFCGYVLEKKFADVGDLPVMYLFEPGEMRHGDLTNVWGGTVTCIERMLRLTGFQPTKTDLYEPNGDRVMIRCVVPDSCKLL